MKRGFRYLEILKMKSRVNCLRDLCLKIFFFNNNTTRINKVTIENNYIRTQSTYTFKVQFPAAAILTENAVFIDFPNEWDRILTLKTPTCSI